MAKKFKNLVMVIAFVAISMICSTGVAFADGTVTVSPVEYGTSVFNTSVTNTSVATLHGSATINGKLEVRAIMPHGLPKSERVDCRWGDFAWSDWRTSNGGEVWAPVGHHGWTHACLVHGVWRQIGGGPGQWNCGNVVKPIGAPLPRGAVKVKWSEIKVVKHFTYTVTLQVEAKASQEASAMASCSLPGVNAASTVHAAGVATAIVIVNARATSSQQAIVKAKAKVVNIKASHEASLFREAKANVGVLLQGQASAYCSQQVSLPPPPKTCTELGTCPPPPSCTELGTCPPPPSCTELGTCPPEPKCYEGEEGIYPNCHRPVKHYTEVSCRGFEEISGGESFLVDCQVSDDNGARISLDAYSNDGNSRVSGINCYSDGGAETCPNGGTFEFRVEGINNSTNIVYSSITVIASANGVEKEFKSNPFPVDPYEGGF